MSSELDLKITRRSFHGKFFFTILSISVSQTLAFVVALLSESTSKVLAALAALYLPLLSDWLTDWHYMISEERAIWKQRVTFAT